MWLTTIAKYVGENYLRMFSFGGLINIQWTESKQSVQPDDSKIPPVAFVFPAAGKGKIILHIECIPSSCLCMICFGGDLKCFMSLKAHEV